MLKVGDKVRVREDLIVGSNYGGEMFCGGYMESLKGRIATIVEVYDCLSYVIDIDEDGWMWTEEMFEIIEKEVSVNMKELTFREVIANIKEGEVWERVDDEYISNRIELKNGQLKLYNSWNGKMDFTLKEAGVIFDKTLYKLKRPQYTFQEAFKAFEEGKEIESCESGDIYNTTEEDVEYKLFYGYEIQGKWYIND
jgi:hypothetical protein